MGTATAYGRGGNRGEAHAVELRLLALAWLAILGIAVVAFSWRGLVAGELVARLGWRLCLAVGVASGAAFAVPRLFVHAAAPDATFKSLRAYVHACRGLLAVWLIELSLNAESSVAVACIWAPALGLEAALLVTKQAFAAYGVPGDENPLDAPLLDRAATTGNSDAGPAATPLNAADDSVADNGATQGTLRRVDNQGIEIVDGWQRVDFLPGQRTAVAHVAFCPPLSVAPNVRLSCELHTLRTRVTQAFAHGMRIELRAPSAADAATSAIVHFTVTAPAPAEQR